MSLYSKWSPIAKLVEKKQWPPFPRHSEEWFKFIEHEKEIFQKGLQIGSERITGLHYWKLNYCKILMLNNRGYKAPALPLLSDKQREFYEALEESLTKSHQDILGLKSRDKGWTYDIAAVALFFMMNEDFSSLMGIFPGGTSVAKSNFRQAYDLAYNELDFDFKHPAIKSTEGKNIEQLRYGVETYEIDPRTGKQTGIKKIIGPQTKMDLVIGTNPSVVRSGRNKIIFIEEVGEIEELEQIIEVADRNLKEGSTKFGIMIAGGTSNMMRSGTLGFKKLWYAPGDKFKKIWIPAYTSVWGKYVDYKTGKSDEEGGRAYHEAERAKLSGDALLTYKQENPFTPEEAFYEGKNSPYNADKCNEQINYILTNKEVSNAIQRGTFYGKRKSNGEMEVVFEIEEKGWWEVYKHPDELKGLPRKPVGAVDSYRLGESMESKSEGAVEIYVPFQGINKPGCYPAAICRGRDDNKEVFFRQCLYAAIAYDCKMLIEYTDEDILTYFRTNAALKYLKERPALIKTEAVRVNKYGVHPTPQARNMATEYAIKDFNLNYHQIVFISLLREMLKFGAENTDRVWAHNWAVLHAADTEPIVEEARKKPKEKTFIPYTAMDDTGRLVVISNQFEAQKLGL